MAGGELAEKQKKVQNSLSQVSQKLTTTPLRGVFTSPSCPDSQDITWEWWEFFDARDPLWLFYRYNMTTPMGQQLYVSDNHIKVKTLFLCFSICLFVFVNLYLLSVYFICVFAGEVCFSQPWCLDLPWLIKSSVASSLAKRFSSCAHEEEVVWDLNSSSEPILCELNLWVQIYQKFSKSWMN